MPALSSGTGRRPPDPEWFPPGGVNPLTDAGFGPGGQTCRLRTQCFSNQSRRVRVGNAHPIGPPIFISQTPGFLPPSVWPLGRGRRILFAHTGRLSTWSAQVRRRLRDGDIRTGQGDIQLFPRQAAEGQGSHRRPHQAGGLPQHRLRHPQSLSAWRGFRSR